MVIFLLQKYYRIAGALSDKYSIYTDDANKEACRPEPQACDRQRTKLPSSIYYACNQAEQGPSFIARVLFIQLSPNSHLKVTGAIPIINNGPVDRHYHLGLCGLDKLTHQVKDIARMKRFLYYLCNTQFNRVGSR
jgi:hypothetical protein